jgi:hypothetical protein
MHILSMKLSSMARVRENEVSLSLSRALKKLSRNWELFESYEEDFDFTPNKGSMNKKVVTYREHERTSWAAEIGARLMVVNENFKTLEMFHAYPFIAKLFFSKNLKAISF